MPDPNEKFRLKLGGRTPLRILLGDKPKTASAPTVAGSPNSRGDSLRKGRGPQRRIIPKKKDKGFITFWDLGQVKVSDHYEDIPFSYPQVDGDGSSSRVDMENTPAHFDDLRDLLLTPPIGTWDTYYKKLGFEDAERYAVDVIDLDTSIVYPVARNGSRYDIQGNLVAGTKWESGGLKLDNPIANFQIQSFGAFGQFSNVTTDFRITNGPTYGSTEVAFTELKKDAKIYLTPKLTSIYALSTGSGGSNQDILFVDIKALQRSWWLDTVDATWGYPLLSYVPGVMDLDPTNKTGLTAHLAAMSQYYNFVDPADPALGDSDDFPQYTSFAEITIENPTTDTGPFRTRQYAIYDEGALAGVIKQNGQTYYFWAKSGSFGDTPARNFNLL